MHPTPTAVRISGIRMADSSDRRVTVAKFPVGIRTDGGTVATILSGSGGGSEICLSTHPPLFWTSRAVARFVPPGASAFSFLFAVSHGRPDPMRRRESKGEDRCLATREVHRSVMGDRRVFKLDALLAKCERDAITADAISVQQPHSVAVGKRRGRA